MTDRPKQEEIYTLTDLSECSSSLVNDDIRPTRLDERTWSRWHIASLWVGMSVCIPTYMLASYMITGGLSWVESIIIILLGNVIVAIPMTLNGHAGTKYGIPFPVLGRATFGVKGVHVPSVLRALVACGWFGVQTWVGGLAIASIIGVLFGNPELIKDPLAQGVGFALFWLIQMFFVLKGTESIKWLESMAAPLLVIAGLAMLGWGVQQAGGISKVLDASEQFAKPTIAAKMKGADTVSISLNLIKGPDGQARAKSWRHLIVDPKGKNTPEASLEKLPYTSLSAKSSLTVPRPATLKDAKQLKLYAQFKSEGSQSFSSKVVSYSVSMSSKSGEESGGGRWLTYLIWLTIMVSFWATLALNISDITRYAATQRDQVIGQFLGLPTTMTLYVFIGVAVTCAAVVIFDQILITQDAPWEPATLISYFKDQPMLVLIAQFVILIATLSTNIAANVISPANSFANLWPEKISFRLGGLMTGFIGILTCPWWLMNEISGFLIAYGAVLGPVIAVLIVDYYFIHRKELKLQDLYQEQGAYTYSNGLNLTAFVSAFIGIAVVFSGLAFESMRAVYDTGWFCGFFVSALTYWLLMKEKPEKS